MIELRHLRHFVAVVEAGGFRQASRCIHLSASSIVRSIKLLEEHYGVSLLERNGHVARPTPFGDQLLAEARDLLTGFDGIAPKLEQVAKLATGRLRVGVPPPVADLLLPPLGGRMLRDYPDVELETRIGSSSDILDWLLAHELDVIIVYKRLADLQKDLESIDVYHETAGWCVRKNHPLLAKSDLAIGDLTGFPIISQPLPALYKEWFEDVLTAAGSGPDGRPYRHGHVCEHYGALFRMAQDSDAILLTPTCTMLASPYKNDLAELPLDATPAPPIDYVAAFPRIPSPSPLARRFVEVACEEVAAIMERLGMPERAGECRDLTRLRDWSAPVPGGTVLRS